MAELNSFLTGIANAIRSKKGTTDKINASNFASEIESIESGSGGGSATVTVPGEWQGTTVPNSGYVDKVYFNTNLNVEEITNIINKEFNPANNGGNTIYLLYSENPETNDYIDIYMDYSYWNRLYFNITIYTSNGFNGYVFSLDERYDDISGTNFTGWNPSFSNPFPVNFEVMNQINGNSIGNKNSLVSFLFSLTPFEYKDEEEASTINLKEYIKEQKLPLQLKIQPPKVTGTKNIYENGIYDVKSYETANVDVPMPNGTYYIYDNGVYDVTNYAKADVYVEIPSGTKNITENGTHNVKWYEYANVEVYGTINPVTNIQFNGNVLSWDAPDISDIDAELISISYIINLNGVELTSNTNSINIANELIEGNNTVSITAKAVFKNNEAEITVKYSVVTIITLSTQLPSGRIKSASSAIGDIIYIFSGVNKNKVYLTEILKFDSTTETITTLSTTLPYGVYSKGVTVGTDIYILGGYINSTTPTDKILKFDSTTETITTLGAKLPAVRSSSCIVAIGTNIYMFGGTDANANRLDTILKFDSANSTVTTLSTKLPAARYGISVVSIGTDAYLFGGYKSTNEILKFDSTSETITTLSTTLPSATYDTLAGVLGKNIYIFDGSNILKFDSATETITTLNVEMSYTSMFRGIASTGTNIYLFGGKNSSTYRKDIVKLIENKE